MNIEDLNFLLDFGKLSKKYNTDIYGLIVLVNKFQRSLSLLESSMLWIILNYRYLHGYTFEEIARSLKISTSKTRELHKCAKEFILQNYE